MTSNPNAAGRMKPSPWPTVSSETKTASKQNLMGAARVGH